VKKVITHNIDYQDGAGTYIEQFHPLATKVLDYGFVGTWNYRSQTDTYALVAREIRINHGPLGALYTQDYISEGDTPAFFYSLPNGLRGGDHPTYGGWGGRYMPSKHDPNVFVDAYDAGSRLQSQARWIRDANADFMARLDWSVASKYNQANHAPIMELQNETDLTVKSGEEFELSIEGTIDPDGDLVDIHWWIYEDAGTFRGDYNTKYQEGYVYRATAPQVDEPKTIHIIAEASDFPAITPSLKAYQRFVITVTP